MAIKVAVRGGVLAWSRHNVGKKECNRDDGCYARMWWVEICQKKVTRRDALECCPGGVRGGGSGVQQEQDDPRRSSHPLSLKDIQWILNVLVANRHVRILSRRGEWKTDVVVFSATPTCTKHKKNLVFFDLQHSTMETRSDPLNITKDTTSRRTLSTSDTAAVVPSSY